MKFDKPLNANYAATVIRIPATLDLPGLDRLVGVPVMGQYQALTQKHNTTKGDLMIAFTTETQLSEEYAAFNNLYRSAELNADKNEQGYLDLNRRIKALRLRGNVSNALLMPLSSVDFTGIEWWELEEGDTFDTINGHPICQKYVVRHIHANNPAKSKVDKAFKRVTTKVFPEHLETDQYGRCKHLLQPGREVVITQKLHGTSWRGGNVPAIRELTWKDRLARRLGIRVVEKEHEVWFGSRKVIKDPGNDRQAHHYDTDLWTAFGQTVKDIIPEGYLVYGELIGFVPGTHTPLQKNYTYDLKSGTAELYVYRVANVNADGFLSDLSWDGVKQFCQARGLKWVPELARVPVDMVDDWLEAAKDVRFFDEWHRDENTFLEVPLILSHHLTVDEGVCLRQEGLTPVILKAKSAVFLEHETRMLDAEEVDIESEQAA